MKKFLIIKPSSLGDVLHAFPAVHALCQTFPGSAADWIIHPAFQELLDYMPCVKRKILFRRKEMGTWNGFFREFPPFLKELRHEHYDAVIDLQGLLRSAIFSRLASAEIHAGPEKPKEPLSRFCYGAKMTFPGSVHHALEKNNAMIQSLFPDKKFNFSFLLPENPEKREAFWTLLRQEAVLQADSGTALQEEAGEKQRKILPRSVGFAPGARWKSKQWGSAFFAAVIRSMHEQQSGLRFFLFGSKAEQHLSREILAQTAGIPVIDLCGKTTMGQLVEGIRAMSLFVSNDSGPMHIAAATGTPVAAMFGPTRPDLTGPYCVRKQVFEPELTCIHCFKRYCDTEICHERLDPAEVAAQSLRLMK